MYLWCVLIFFPSKSTLKHTILILCLFKWNLLTSLPSICYPVTDSRITPSFWFLFVFYLSFTLRSLDEFLIDLQFFLREWQREKKLWDEEAIAVYWMFFCFLFYFFSILAKVNHSKMLKLENKWNLIFWNCFTWA